MILPSRIARRVLTGTKTTHRYPVRKQEVVRQGKPQEEESRCVYTTGHLHVVKSWKWVGTGEHDEKTGEELMRRTAPKVLCHVRVTGIHRGQLKEMSEADARAEGYDSLEDFRSEWWTRYGWGHNTAGKEVWVVEFVVDEDVPRLLAVDGRGAYTHSDHSALKGEPEAVSDAWLEKFGEEGARNLSAHRSHQEKLRHDLTDAQRLEETLLKAKAEGVDVSSDLRVIRKRLDAIDRKLRGRRAP